jgi:cytochrome c-type biogenesis protein CcmF
MAELGATTITMALALAAYAAVGSFVGVQRSVPGLLVSARRATYLTSMVLAVATVTLVIAFLRHDFAIQYVAEHSNLSMPGIYTWVAFYAGNEGSLLYVAMVLSAVAALTLRLLPHRLGPLRPYTNAVLMLILTFYLTVLVTMANPFSQMEVVPLDGRGINPLLTHPGMFIHPPLIMLGLIATAVPFSLAMAGLLAKKIDDDWVDWGRAWGMIAWALLGMGLLLGAWWAYTILGWGGYWGWDPVENAALMPFLGLTAFIHSIMVQKRRGMFRMWNVVLINITFALGNFGIFINRGGPVPSVHSFGASSLGWVFLLFLGVTVVASFGLFFYRLGILKSAQRLESALSREAAFLVNNLLLLGIAFITLWGVVFPLLSEAVTGRTITVAAPFYNQVNGPLLLALIFLMGVGPMLPWRRATWGSVRKATTVPLAISAALIVALVGFGMREPAALVGFGVGTMVAISVLQEWARGTRARHRSSGPAYPMAFLQLMAANRPRYGGYVVHLAVVMLAFGIVGSSFFDLERDIILPIGERAEIGRYQVEFVRTDTMPFADRTERTATVRIYRDGQYLETLTAWQAIYPSFRMISTRAAIRSTPVEDLYVLFSELQPDGRSAAFRILVNPLVWWMWVSGPVLLLGTLIALWPSRQQAVAYVARPVQYDPARPVDTVAPR